MSQKSQVFNGSLVQRVGARWVSRVWSRNALLILGAVLVVFLATYHLTSFPTTWFDEGSHLHVPKTLVRYGVYADMSSEGFRYYGPTVGVGPTVMLPIAAAFELFGIGLAQARVVMVLYLLAAVGAFYALARRMGGATLALVATALLVTSRGITFFEYGRQVLGEVPGFLFMAAGLAVWFTGWGQASWRRLAAAGLLFGLSTVTKNQYLLVLGPALLLGWIANLIYYKSVPQRVFLVPGILTAASYGAWNVVLMLFLGPGTAGQNLALLRQATEGAALVFSPALIRRAISLLASPNVFLGMLAPAMLYGLALALPRDRDGQRWGVIFLLAVVNLGWYVLASISWLRYAFPGLALACLFVARFFSDLTGGFRLGQAERAALASGTRAFKAPPVLKVVLAAWLAVMIALPLAQTAKDVIFPPFNAPAAMAAYLDQNVPKGALIETWEPEMGFLTDHHYHFPPPGLLNTAVGYIWLERTPPAQEYHYVQENRPPYVLVGGFAQWVQLYPADYLAANYDRVTSIGSYQLYALKK